MVTRFNTTDEWSTQIEPIQILSNSQLQTTEYKLFFFPERLNGNELEQQTLEPFQEETEGMNLNCV